MQIDGQKADCAGSAAAVVAKAGNEGGNKPPRMLAAAKSVASEEAKHCETCGLDEHCEAHPCHCVSCLVGKPSACNCALRQSIKDFLGKAATKKARRAHLARWRKVKKNPKLKQPPSYFHIARDRGIVILSVLGLLL